MSRPRRRRITVRRETTQAPPEIPHTAEDLPPDTHRTRIRSYASAIGWTIDSILEATTYLDHTARILTNQATTELELHLYAQSRHVTQAVMRATARLGRIHRKALRGPRNPPHKPT